MHIFNIHDAKTHFSKLIEYCLRGEDVMIAKAGKPIAKLGPIRKKSPSRKLGLLKGKIKIAKDFDAPLSEELLKEFEG